MTKKILPFAAIALALILSSCSKSVEPATVEIDGPLAKSFTLADEKYPVEKDGDKCFITVNVTRTDVTVPFTDENVAAFGGDVDDETSAIAGFDITLLGANDATISKFEAADNKDAAEEVEDILTLKPGEIGTLTVQLDPDNIPAKIKLTSAVKFISTGKIRLDGAVGKYAVKNFDITYNFKKGTVSGKYQYKTSPAGAFLYFEGETQPLIQDEDDSNTWTSKSDFSESSNGSWSGRFNSTLTLTRDKKTEPYYWQMTGEFLNFRFDTFAIHLKSAPIENEK